MPGIDVTLIKRCGNILSAIASGHKINIQTFQKYCWDTAQLLVDAYPWYYMPASVHKILIHGSIIIENAILPIGQLSEEAQEARNKDIKLYRTKHTRKISRIKTNTDLLSALMVSSDPLITAIRPLPKKQTKTLSADVQHLLAINDDLADLNSSTCSVDAASDENDFSESD